MSQFRLLIPPCQKKVIQCYYYLSIGTSKAFILRLNVTSPDPGSSFTELKSEREGALASIRRRRRRRYSLSSDFRCRAVPVQRLRVTVTERIRRAFLPCRARTTSYFFLPSNKICLKKNIEFIVYWHLISILSFTSRFQSQSQNKSESSQHECRNVEGAWSGDWFINLGC